MVILASGSPRRRELLSMLGIKFMVSVSDADEDVPDGLTPAETVEYLAYRKYEAVAGKTEGHGDVIVSADTIVVYDGIIYGKPADETEAVKMLRTLSGNTHQVYTGVCVNGECSHVVSSVTFRKLCDDEIIAYVKTGEPMDKAGAYGIQGIGSVIVEHIDGDYFNIMGLPVCRLAQMLKKYGVSVI